MTYEEKAASMNVAEVAALLASHAELTQQLVWFKHQLFGPKSERRLLTPTGRQLWLGEAGERAPAPSPPEILVAAHRRRTSAPRSDGAPEVRFDPSVPVETIEVPNPQVPPSALDQYDVVGEKVTCRLAQRPGSFVVLRYVRKVLKRKGDGLFSCPPAPSGVLEQSAVDVSFLAGLVIDKLSYHLPLYRQHQRLAAAGVHLGRSTLTTYFHRTAELLEPIYEAQLASILESSVLAMDETPIKAGRKKGKPPKRGRMKTGYFWPVYGDRDEVAFPFAPTRGHHVVHEVLNDYAGTIVTDGYEAYDRYAARTAEVELAHCWAHARRGFIEAEETEPKLVAEVLGQISALYEHDAWWREGSRSSDEILAHRQEHCRPIVDAFFATLTKALEEQVLLPTSPFTKAARYALDREVSLRVFLDDPEVPMDTNHLERTVRAIAIGRKNWMFCSTEVGARYVGSLQSLLVTCRLQGVDPYTYLVDVLQRIQKHPAKRVHELIPRLWKDRFAANPMRSDLDRAATRDQGKPAPSLPPAPP